MSGFPHKYKAAWLFSILIIIIIIICLHICFFSLCNSNKYLISMCRFFLSDLAVYYLYDIVKLAHYYLKIITLFGVYFAVITRWLYILSYSAIFSSLLFCLSIGAWRNDGPHWSVLFGEPSPWYGGKVKLDSSVCLVIELIRSDLDLLPSIKSEADDGTAFWRVESKLSL